MDAKTPISDVQPVTTEPRAVYPSGYMKSAAADSWGSSLWLLQGAMLFCDGIKTS